MQHIRGCSTFPCTPGLSGGRSHFSGFQVKELALKMDLMFVSVSSADKDAEKTFDGFNRMHMIWIDRICDRGIEEVRVRSHSLTSKYSSKKT